MSNIDEFRSEILSCVIARVGYISYIMSSDYSVHILSNSEKSQLSTDKVIELLSGSVKVGPNLYYNYTYFSHKNSTKYSKLFNSVTLILREQRIGNIIDYNGD